MVDPSRVSCEPATRLSGQALESHQYRIAQPLEKSGTPGGIRISDRNTFTVDYDYDYDWDLNMVDGEWKITPQSFNIFGKQDFSLA